MQTSDRPATAVTSPRDRLRQGSGRLVGGILMFGAQSSTGLTRSTGIG